MKKICIILPTHLPVPTVNGGAVETLVERFIDENERKHRFDITVVSIFDDIALGLSKKYKFTTFEYFHINNYLYNLDKLYRKFYHKVFGKNPKFTMESKAAERIIKKNTNFDYLVIEGGDKNFVYIANKYYKKNQVLLHIHGSIKADSELSDKVGCLIAVSRYIEKIWNSNLVKKNNKTKVLKNCIDIENFTKNLSQMEKKEIRNKYGFKDDDFVILFTGRIIPEKGVRELIQAINKIDDEAISLLIVGSSNFGVKTSTNYEKEIQKVIRGSKKKIVFTGFIHNSELYKLHQISNIAIVPSTWEDPAPLVPIEAMASGLPLIVTRSGGMIEYVNTDCAIILEKDENLIDNISKAIINLKRNQYLMDCMSKNGKELASQYDSKKYYENFCRIINDIDEEENANG